MTPSSIGIAQRKADRTPRRLRRALSLDDFEVRARRLLPLSMFGYVSGGVETNSSLRANRAAFQAISFEPRIMRDVSTRSQKTRLFGNSYGVPFGIAPMGFSALVAYDGDVALARGARSAGSFAICSAASLTPLERVAREAGSRWFQAYVPGDDDRILALVDRVAAAGFDHLVITGDVPVTGNRENNARNGFDAPFRITPQLIWQGMTHPRWTIGTLGRELFKRGMPHFENMESVQGPPLFSRNLVRSTIARDKLTWEHLKLIRARFSGKLILKGVLSPEDARLARQTGCDGIIVSNHGGRQLDGAVAPIVALPAIRKAVPDMTVMLDSGIRRGTDVLRAIMLGADFVFVGRPLLYAAATDGEAGVSHAMGLLRDEIDRDMALMGIVSPHDLRVPSA
ncbi:alpha-hydroxy acid oxidase [Martelella mediterranea]|uniref:(S)-mandelate dehydrogenase n=1 Tax=Martelella mediterranea DSM 17316 TaxID=1122214 RepID=A0A1U9YZR5_9HYPH|nr:alpha-hydroxy acid oxidase [Martelella mediterranea]AQZ50908.1 (S)-mandelate dehydrogenase [Martelella mediterranea DSM 17316]